jgi:hypothetical protein
MPPYYRFNAALFHAFAMCLIAGKIRPGSEVSRAVFFSLLIMSVADRVNSSAREEGYLKLPVLRTSS